MSGAATLPSPAFNGATADPLDSLFRISVDMYHEMIQKGILGPEDQVELFEGFLAKKMAKNEPHIYSNGQLLDLLAPLVKSVGFINDQQPVVFSDSEPEPDISIIRGTRQQFRGRKPQPQDVLLLIEISDTSLARDQGPRKALFAREGIVQYWIVNLIDDQVELYTEPSGPTTNPDYGNKQIYANTDAVPLILEGIEVGRVDVADLL